MEGELMICPYCGGETHDGSKFCEECGRKLPQNNNYKADTLVKSSEAVFAIGAAAREARLTADYSGVEQLSRRGYNCAIIAVLLWGLIVNAVLCATVGNVYRLMNPVLFLILYFVCCFAGIYIAGRSRNPLVSFLGYNMIVVPFGLTVSTLVEAYGGINSQVVRDAFIYTTLISVGMLGTSIAFPELFKNLGGALLGCLIGLIVCEVVLLLFRVDQIVTDWIAAGLFSLYIAYDIHRSQQFTPTLDNAVDCALDIYMDIANLFIRLLRIMSKSKKE